MRCSKNSVYPLFFVLLWLLGTVWQANAIASEERTVNVYFFWKDGCPHCEREKDFLTRWQGEETRVRVHYLEISRETDNYEVFAALVRQFGIERPGVPLTVVGETFFDGYNDESTTGAAIKSAASDCFEVLCRDLVWPLLTGQAKTPVDELARLAAKAPDVLKLPIFGEVTIGQALFPC